MQRGDYSSFPPISPHIFLSLMFYQDFPKCIRVSNPHPRVSGGALKVLELVEKVSFLLDQDRMVFLLCRLSKASYCSESREMEEMVNIPGDKPISSLWAAGICLVYLCIFSHSPWNGKYTQCLLMEWVAIVRESMLQRPRAYCSSTSLDSFRQANNSSLLGLPCPLLPQASK